MHPKLPSSILASSVHTRTPSPLSLSFRVRWNDVFHPCPNGPEGDKRHKTRSDGHRSSFLENRHTRCIINLERMGLPGSFEVECERTCVSAAPRDSGRSAFVREAVSVELFSHIALALQHIRNREHVDGASRRIAPRPTRSFCPERSVKDRFRHSLIR